MNAHTTGPRPQPTFRKSRTHTQPHSRSRSRAVLAMLLLAGATLAVALPAFALFAHGRAATAAQALPAPVARSAAARQTKHSTLAAQGARVAATTSDSATASKHAGLKPSAKSAASIKPKHASATQSKRTLAAVHAAAKRRPAAPAGPSIAAYKGLGSWVDIYDDKAFKDPAATVRDMAAHGVKTLFIETGNFHTSGAINNPAALTAFIRACHAKHMRIVAWYLPNLKSGSVDYVRATKALHFKTPDGQKFDSFALDIESTAVSSASARNRGLAALSKKIRGLVGRSYPLGAIIPSPVGLSQKRGYWDAFPYAMIAGYYDVFLPMGYYTYHGGGASAAHADAAANVRILRSQKGCSAKPIHLIGGISDDSSAAQVKAFVSATRSTRCFGASLYGWAGTSKADWKALEQVR